MYCGPVYILDICNVSAGLRRPASPSGIVCGQMHVLGPVCWTFALYQLGSEGLLSHLGGFHSRTLVVGHMCETAVKAKKRRCPICYLQSHPRLSV